MMENNNINLSFITVFVNFSHLAFGEFYSKVFGFFTIIYLARVLGAAGFGFYGFVSSVSTYFILFSNFGIEQYSSQRLASSNSLSTNNLIGTVIGARLLLSLFFICIFIGFGFFYSKNESELYLFIFQSIFIIAFAFNLQFYFVAFKNTLILALLKTSIGASIFFGSYFLIKSQSDLALVTLISGTTTLFFFVWAVWFVFHKEKLKMRFSSLHGILSLLKNSAPLGISALMIQIYYSADIVFLGFTNPGLELGYYTGAYRIILLFTAIPGLFYLTFLPDLAKITSNHFRMRSTRLYVGILICFGFILTVDSNIFAE